MLALYILIPTPNGRRFGKPVLKIETTISLYLFRYTNCIHVRSSATRQCIYYLPWSLERVK